MKYITMALVALLIPIVLAAGCVEQAPAPPQTQEGRVVFAITDAAANMSAVSGVKITVDKVSVHSDASGWTTISSTPKTYDLLELRNGTLVALADVQLNEGAYQQVRLDISSVIVTDANGTHDARLPSGELRIAGEFTVEANTTATATFDFIVDESLHITGNGEYIMAPVVRLETRNNAEVTVDSNNRVEITGGTVKTSVKVGMDAGGSVGVGLSIPRNIPISIGTGGKIKIGLGV